MEANAELEEFTEVLKDTTSMLQISNFFNNEELSDVVMVVGDKKFYAHRFVLAKCSNVFKTMMYGKHWPESVGEEVTLKETPECEAVFDLFVKYLYAAEVKIDVQTAVGILSLADKYDVTSLKDLCLSYMLNQSHVVKIETAMSWYICAKTMHFSALVSACFEAITLNTNSLIKSTMWVDLNIDFLEKILSTSELVIDQEYDLFVGLSQWLLDESRVTSLKVNSKRLLPLIRFPQMRAKELLEAEQSKLAKDRESTGILHKLIGRAFRFQAVYPTEDSPSFSGINFCEPRDYLTFNVIYRGEGFRSSFTERGFYIEKRAGKLEATVEAYMRPVISHDLKNGVWLISSECVDNSVWKVTLSSKDLLDKTVNIQFSLLVTDVCGKVIQCTRTYVDIWEVEDEDTFEVELSHPDKAAYLVVLIKPMLYDESEDLSE